MKQICSAVVVFFEFLVILVEPLEPVMSNPVKQPISHQEPNVQPDEHTSSHLDKTEKCTHSLVLQESSVNQIM